MWSRPPTHEAIRAAARRASGRLNGSARPGKAAAGWSAYHAAADELLAAFGKPHERQPSEAALRVLRALRALRTHSLADADIVAYLERRGPTAVYSSLLSVLRAGREPERYVTDVGERAPPAEADDYMRLLDGDGAFERIDGWNEQVVAPLSVREFAIAPFDERASMRVWLIETADRGVLAASATRYERMLVLDVGPADKFFLARSIQLHLVRDPDALEQVD